MIESGGSEMIEKYRGLPRNEVMENIEYYIMNNNLKPHMKLPSERDLCEIW